MKYRIQFILGPMIRPRGALRVAEDIVPVSELKAHAADELTERACLAAAVEEGLRDAEAGRVHPHAELKAELSRRYRKSSP